MKYTVEMFGLSPFTEANAVDLELKDGASLPDLLAALARKMPSFKGRIIEAGERHLVENYGIYINGQFVSEYEGMVLKPTDRIVIILLAVGG